MPGGSSPNSMWTTFKTMLSHVAPYYFNLESTLILHSLTIPAIQRRTNDDNVLHATQLPLRLQKRKGSSILEGVGPRSSLADNDTSRDTDAKAPWEQFSRENGYLQRKRQANDNTTTADQESETTAITVSLSTDLASGSATSGSRSTASTGSSSIVQTTAPSNDASGTEQTPSVAPTTPTLSSPPSTPAASDDAISGASASISESPASKTTAVDASSSQDRSLSPSTIQVGSTAQTSAKPSETSSTEREASGTSISSTKESSSAVLTQDTSTTTTASREISTSLSSEPSTTGRGTNTNTTSTPVTVSPSSQVSTRGPVSSPPESTTAEAVSSALSSASRSSVTTSYAPASTSSAMTTAPLPSSQSSLTTASPTEESLTSFWTTTTTFRPISSPSYSFSSIVSVSSNSDALPSSSIFSTLTSSPNDWWASSNTAVVPITTTLMVFTTARANKTTTTMETGALRTDISTASAFSQNTGAIVGVAIAAFVALLCLLFCIFFACRRYRRRQRSDGYTDGIMHPARQVSWRRPVDGDDDDSYVEKKSYSHRQAARSHGHSSDGMHDTFEGTSHGDHFSNGHGSAESTSATMVPMSIVFGGQSCIPGLEHDHGLPIQHAVGSSQALVPPGFLSRTPTGTSIDAWRVPAGSYLYIDTGATRSAASLALPAGSSRDHTYSASSTEETAKPHMKRKSLSGPRPMNSKSIRRHSSTPPTAFMGVRQSTFDYEQQAQPQEQAEKSTVRTFIDRLRSGRRTSTQSAATVRGSSRRRESDESVLPSVSVFSPSLLNPPVVVTPSRPVLTFPRGVTGNSYTLPSTPGADAYDGTTDVLWPPATLPEIAPSPVPTDNSSMADHLLHPRLALGLARSEQASIASFRDNEDYSRPINGRVDNRLRSTTTFEMHDTAESDQDRGSPRA